jgi:hypothetical protein
MIGMRKLKFSTVSPCYSYGLLSAIEAIHGVGPLPILFNIPEFSKMCITLMQLIYMCGTVTCFYSVFEYYCTTESCTFQTFLPLSSATCLSCVKF